MFALVYSPSNRNAYALEGIRAADRNALRIYKEAEMIEGELCIREHNDSLSVRHPLAWMVVLPYLVVEFHAS